jgi:hypothetical protein
MSTAALLTTLCAKHGVNAVTNSSPCCTRAAAMSTALCAKLGIDATPYVANTLTTFCTCRGNADGAQSLARHRPMDNTVSSYLQTGPRPEGYPGVRHDALLHGINKLSITKRIHADLAVYMCC